MTWQDYMAIGVVVLNLVSNMRHRKFTMQAFEKALFNNRRLLANTLADVAKAFVTQAPAKTTAKPATPVEEAEVVEDPSKVGANDRT